MAGSNVHWNMKVFSIKKKQNKTILLKKNFFFIYCQFNVRIKLMAYRRDQETASLFFYFNTLINILFCLFSTKLSSGWFYQFLSVLPVFFLPGSSGPSPALLRTSTTVTIKFHFLIFWLVKSHFLLSLFMKNYLCN